MNPDGLLARLPQSTDAFSCPWWESFASCCVASIVLGICSMTVLGVVPAVLALVFLWQHTAHRVRAVLGRDGDGGGMTC